MVIIVQHFETIYKIYVQNISSIRVKGQIKSNFFHNHFIYLFFITYIIQKNI